MLHIIEQKTKQIIVTVPNNLVRLPSLKDRQILTLNFDSVKVPKSVIPFIVDLVPMEGDKAILPTLVFTVWETELRSRISIGPNHLTHTISTEDTFAFVTVLGEYCEVTTHAAMDAIDALSIIQSGSLSFDFFDSFYRLHGCPRREMEDDEECEDDN